jgi:hypothetical protein
MTAPAHPSTGSSASSSFADVTGRDPDDDEPIPVALARPRKVERAPRRRQDPTDAGLVPLVVAALVAVAGWFVGGALGAHVSGAILGGLVGLVVGMIAMYKKYSDV